jgi:hypothetical protein
MTIEDLQNGEVLFWRRNRLTVESAPSAWASRLRPTPFSNERAHDLAFAGNGTRLLAASSPSCLGVSTMPGRVRRRRKTSRCVARTRNVSRKCPRVLA